MVILYMITLVIYRIHITVYYFINLGISIIYYNNYKFVDFCQIELRILAYIANDEKLISYFKDGNVDIFQELTCIWLIYCHLCISNNMYIIYKICIYKSLNKSELIYYRLHCLENIRIISKYYLP